jgi:hypothetical protein|tara:strand:- start:2316 stop:2495 length:180 start_codon:yes stop_codon:yes gene_type:complete
MLENNLNEARRLISVLQGKVARQRDDITRLRDRDIISMSDKKQMAKELNEFRDAKNAYE